MKCSNWRLDISACLDNSLRATESAAVEEHLKGCADCVVFYEEQRALNQTFREAFADMEPPARIWHNIEDRLTSGPRPITSKLVELFRIPRMAYAGAAFVFVLVCSLFVLETPETVDRESRYLAELEAFEIEVEGNPFLQDVQAENPFMKLSQFELGNPFERLGGSRQ